MLYSEKEKFEVGEFKILKQSKKDRVVLVGAGITLHECIKASETLSRKKINAAVADIFCVKPFNARKFIKFVKGHGNKVVIAEDHYPEGGIGEMLAEELENSGINISHLAVRREPHSGKSKELLARYGIDSGTVVKSARKILRK